MAYILHIETATEQCSVALSNENQCIAEISTDEHHSHSSLLAPFIKQIIEENIREIAQLSAVSLSAGPGSYTGLRVGSSTAKGICYALDIPLITVSTLKSLAQPSLNSEFEVIIPTIDARRMEVYTAFFEKDLIQTKEDHAQVIDEDYLKSLSKKYKSVLFCGNATEKIAAICEYDHIKFEKTICRAKNLIEISWDLYQKNAFSDLAYFEPNYIKGANITVPKPLL